MRIAERPLTSTSLWLPCGSPGSPARTLVLTRTFDGRALGTRFEERPVTNVSLCCPGGSATSPARTLVLTQTFDGRAVCVRSCGPATSVSLCCPCGSPGAPARTLVLRGAIDGVERAGEPAALGAEVDVDPQLAIVGGPRKS